MGRPKLFDRTEVLERALDVFWEFGYHEASTRRLAAAMDINVATIFSEFGDKEGLYAHALQNYETLKLPLFIGALERPGSDLQTVLRVLRDFAQFASTGTAPGCLITNSAIELAPNPQLSRDALTRYIERLQSAYWHALSAPSTGTPPLEAQVLLNQARFLAVTTLGLFVMIRAKVAPDIVIDTVEGTIATLLSALRATSAVEADTAPHDRSITPGIAGSTSAKRKGLAP